MNSQLPEGICQVSNMIIQPGDKPFKMTIAIRKVTKRGYVYIGRANAGQDVEITTKPSAPKITAKAI